MNLSLSEDQRLLENTAARLFGEESTPARIRAAEVHGGFDRSLWNKAFKLGLIPMRADGASLLDASIVAEQAGRHLASIPLCEAIVATALLRRFGIVDPGVATFAVAPPTRRLQSAAAANVADFVVTLDGNELVAIRPKKGNEAAASVLINLDDDRINLASGNTAHEAYAAATEEWRLLSAAVLVGMGRKALELAAAYARDRIQFDRPIGSFQGVAHPLADAITDIDGAGLLIRRAVWGLATGRDDAAATSAMAWWWAGEAAKRSIQRAVRAFGGYGTSLEYDIQLYYRRSKVLSLSGDAPGSLDAIADRLISAQSPPLPNAGEVEMDFSYGAAADAYAAELCAFVDANMTPEVERKKHFSTSGYHPGFHKKLAEAGYAFPDLSVDGAPPRRSRYEVVAAAALWEDIGWTRVPSTVTEMVGKLVERWSQSAAREEIIPRFVHGDALACLGFSEPGAGSDVFSARFSAVRDGDEWVMNGQKMFTTNAQNADYILMLTRTDSSGKKHEGLTMFVMPLKVPGVEIHSVHTLQDELTNIVYFGDVRVHDRYRIGEVGGGLRVMAHALELEHSAGVDFQFAQRAMMRHAWNWALRAQESGRTPMMESRVRRAFARAETRLLVADLLCRRTVWGSVEKCMDPSWGSMAKLFTSEALLEDTSAIIELAAPTSAIRGLDADIDVVESMMRRSLAMTIYGGTSEIHRSIIAENALGMPRSRV